MNVLLTNDDGIYAQGLWALYNRFAEKTTERLLWPRIANAVPSGMPSP